MASSETAASSTSETLETLITSRNREISLFLPFLIGLNAASPDQDSANPSQELQNIERIILVNPFTQGMVVIERSGDSNALGMDSWLRDLFLTKDGQPPASKASVEAMPSVEIVGGEKEGEACSICLEEWEGGAVAKEMPCKHIFHGGCIDKWLEIHGSCPVCRYKMPVEEGDDAKVKAREESGTGGGRRREIWMRFSVGSDRSDSDAAIGSSSLDL